MCKLKKDFPLMIEDDGKYLSHQRYEKISRHSLSEKLKVNSA